VIDTILRNNTNSDVDRGPEKIDNLLIHHAWKMKWTYLGNMGSRRGLTKEMNIGLLHCVNNLFSFRTSFLVPDAGTIIVATHLDLTLIDREALKVDTLVAECVEKCLHSLNIICPIKTSQASH
jgi:hypothetical protein